MTKATTKKKPAPKKKSVKAAKPSAAKKKAKASATPAAPVGKQPQSKQKAAAQAGFVLQASDAWTKAYFDPNDLHCLERKLLG